MIDLANAFLYGALAALSAVAALLFLRYWRKSRDRFFTFIAAAFLLLAANWTSLAGRASEEHAAYFYLPRLAAFLVLLVGIVDKNRRAARADKAPAAAGERARDDS